MLDRAKVIKGLECCYASFPKLKGCPVCPYEKICYHDRACDDLLHDALTLLKEQSRKQVLSFGDGYAEGYKAKDQEIVRCKDCRFREECNQKMAYDPDWFCADGIRQKD